MRALYGRFSTNAHIYGHARINTGNFGHTEIGRVLPGIHRFFFLCETFPSNNLHFLCCECTWNRIDIKNRGENSHICSADGITCRVGIITAFTGSHRGAPLPVPTWTYAWTTPGSAGTSPSSTLRVLSNIAWNLPSNNINIIEFWEVHFLWWETWHPVPQKCHCTVATLFKTNPCTLHEMKSVLPVEIEPTFNSIAPAGWPVGFYRISTTKKTPNIDQISTTQHFIDQISTTKVP